MAKVLNIEISDSTVSVCCAAKRGKGLRLFKSFVFPTPEGCVSDGMITDLEQMARSLKNQLAENGLGRMRSVIFSLASSRIAVREVKLPPMKKKLMHTAISTNAEQYFPIDLSNYRLNHLVLEQPSTLRPFYRVLVLATPIAMLNAYVRLAEKAGLSLRAIDTAGNSQYQLFKNLDSKGVSLYADIGSTGSSISFIKDGALLLQRSFAHGPDELIAHYMAKTGRTQKDYLQLMRELDISDPDFSADRLMDFDDIYGDLTRLSTNIIRSIDYFGSTQWGAGISRIVLTGINRHLVGLRDMIFEATGIETLYLDEIHEFSVLMGGAEGAAAFTSCLGSNLSTLALNPEPGRRKKKRQSGEESSLVPGLAICLLIVFLAGGLSAKAYFDVKSAEESLQSLQQEVESLRPVMEVYSRYNSYLGSDAELTQLEEMLWNPNDRLVDFLAEFEAKMPEALRLLSASFTAEGISMNLTASGDTDAAALLAALRGFAGIESVEISELTKLEGDNISFSISLRYGENPYLSGTNPYLETLYEANEDETAASASPSDE